MWQIRGANDKNCLEIRRRDVNTKPVQKSRMIDVDRPKFGGDGNSNAENTARRFFNNEGSINWIEARKSGFEIDISKFQEYALKAK